MTPPAASWLAALPSLLIFAAVTLVPGLVLGRVGGLRGPLLWGVAPVFTAALYAVAAVGGRWLGLRWSPVVIVASVAVLVGGYAGVLRVLRRVGGDAGRPTVDAGRGGPAVPAVPAIPALRDAPVGALGALWTAYALGVLAIAIPAMSGMGDPGEIIDSPDSVFHLSRIRSILLTGDASSFAGPFYPSAFHEMVTAGMQFGAGADVIRAANLFALTCAAVIWPLGCVALVREIFGPRRLVTVLGALAAASFTAFPSILMGWGVLWPNLLGTALVPGAMALLIATVRDARGPMRGHLRRPGTIGCCVAMVGLFFAHPNALVMAGVFAVVWLVTTLVAQTVPASASDRWRPLGLLAALLIGCATFLVVAPRISPTLASTASYSWSDTQSWQEALGDFAFQSVQWPTGLWGNVALVGIGIGWVLWREPRATAVVLNWVACLVLYLLCATTNSELARLVTGFWYNDRARVAAFAVVVTVPLMVAGAMAIAEGLAAASARLSAGLSAGLRARLSARVSKAPRRGRTDVDRLSTWVLVAAVGVLVLATAGLQWGPRTQLVDRYYHPAYENQIIATRPMVEEMIALAARVPTDAVIAAAPESGAGLLYAVSGHPALFTTIPPGVWASTADQRTIGSSIDKAGTDPAVCLALHRTGVGYVLFGEHRYWLNRPEWTTGLYAVREGPGFEVIAQGSYFTLLRITACR